MAIRPEHADQRGCFTRAVELRCHVRRARSAPANRVGLGETGVLFVRLAGLPAILLAPLAGWLVDITACPVA